MMLTARQSQCLHFIVQYTFEHLYQPSILEIGAHMGIASKNGVAYHLAALVRKGYVRPPDKNMSRALKLEDRALLLVKCSDALRARPVFRPGAF